MELTLIKISMSPTGDEEHRTFRRLTEQMYAALQQRHHLPSLEDITSCNVNKLGGIGSNPRGMRGCIAYVAGSTPHKGTLLFEKAGRTMELCWERFRGEVFITDLSIDFGSSASDGTASGTLRLIDEDLRKHLYVRPIKRDEKDSHGLADLIRDCRTY